ADEAEKFFDKMSEKYKDYGNVIYEICNEPNGGVDWSSVKSYAEKIIPVIRANAPEAIIIVGTPTWSQDVDKAAADPITDYENIMYALHFYADTHRDYLRDRMRKAIDAGLPVIVSEFGICDASGSGQNNYDEGNKWISAMDECGVSYFIWNLSNKYETSALIAGGNNKLSDFSDDDLSESGRWYKEVLGK
ncbi:MAG: glycoside hydrolase family 5 protein, partial [Lachnospiraceae bacterium]